jgi:hypothetical protein
MVWPPDPEIVAAAGGVGFGMSRFNEDQRRRQKNDHGGEFEEEYGEDEEQRFAIFQFLLHLSTLSLLPCHTMMMTVLISSDCRHPPANTAVSISLLQLLHACCLMQ